MGKLAHAVQFIFWKVEFEDLGLRLGLGLWLGLARLLLVGNDLLRFGGMRFTECPLGFERDSWQLP